MFKMGCIRDIEDIIEYLKQNKKVSKEEIWNLFYHGEHKAMFMQELDIMVDKSKIAYENDKKMELEVFILNLMENFMFIKNNL